MTFNIFTTQRVSGFGQYDRIDDLIPFNLRGDKCPVFRQFLVDEFHVPAVFKSLDPLFVLHFHISPGEISLYGEYALFGAGQDSVALKAMRLHGVIAEAAPHWGLIIVLPGTVTAQDKQ
ncbi:MAG: hypothetical protein WA867_08010 [Candidatus Acidiferrales bacterium]